MSDDTLERLQKTPLNAFTAGDIVAALEGWAREKGRADALLRLECPQCAGERVSTETVTKQLNETVEALDARTRECESERIAKLGFAKQWHATMDERDAAIRARKLAEQALQYKEMSASSGGTASSGRDPVRLEYLDDANANVRVIGIAAEAHRKPGSLGIVWLDGGDDWRVIAEDSDLPDASRPVYECAHCKRALRSQFGEVGPLSPHVCSSGPDPLRWGICPHDVVYKDCRHASCRKWMAEETRRVTGVDVVAFTHAQSVHILDGGRALCRFSVSLPEKWPGGHFWVRLSEEKDATCEACKSFAQDLKGGGDV